MDQRDFDLHRTSSPDVSVAAPSTAEPPADEPPTDEWVTDEWPREPVESGPWPAAARPRPDGGRSDIQVFKIALLAGLTGAILTAAMGFALFLAMSPGLTPLPAGSDRGAAVASTAPSLGLSPSASPVAASTVVAAGPTAADGGSSIVTATARALPGVVTITTQTALGYRSATDVGSGFVFDSNGWILTNGHVVDGANSITVQLADGRQLTGQVFGIASSTDLAVIKVDAAGLPALRLGDSKGLALGQAVIAIGSPLGEFPDSVSTGVVSGLDRSISVRGLGTLTGLIQTDAAINPGNSGGPLLDTSGRVVGVATATSNSAQGISFAIPIDVARSIIDAALAGQPIP
jgi:S1-C subfamily serine protease